MRRCLVMTQCLITWRTCSLVPYCPSMSTTSSCLWSSNNALLHGMVLLFANDDTYMMISVLLYLICILLKCLILTTSWFLCSATTQWHDCATHQLGAVPCHAILHGTMPCCTYEPCHAIVTPVASTCSWLTFLMERLYYVDNIVDCSTVKWC